MDTDIASAIKYLNFKKLIIKQLATESTKNSVFSVDSVAKKKVNIEII
ncbi:MAG: hypothetical protein PF442_04930 [Desulfobulbaceae bacterium]|jgi:hypothetical protein|nr:hypothetical protein [Desulfobulbaceae bacterium]